MPSGIAFFCMYGSGGRHIRRITTGDASGYHRAAHKGLADMEDPVFENCSKLCATDIDGNKFMFDNSKTNYHYARIFDKIKGEEGYFTMR